MTGAECTQSENKASSRRLSIVIHISFWYLDWLLRIMKMLDRHLTVMPILQIAIRRNSVLSVNHNLHTITPWIMLFINFIPTHKLSKVFGVDFLILKSKVSKGFPTRR